jgi:hypothetical protein
LGDVRVLTSEAMHENQLSNGIPFDSLPESLQQKLRQSCNQFNAESKPKKFVLVVSTKDSQTSSNKSSVLNQSVWPIILIVLPMSLTVLLNQF